MHLSDRRRVVVDESHPRRPSGALDFDFLVDFAPHGRLIGFEALSPFGVFFRDVPADTQRSQAMQPRLALRLASGVTKRGIAASEHDVRNNLLPARVVLDLRTRQELNQLGDEQTAHVTLGLRRESLKTAEAIELGAGDNKNTFVEFGAHQRSREGPVGGSRGSIMPDKFAIGNGRGSERSPAALPDAPGDLASVNQGVKIWQNAARSSGSTFASALKSTTEPLR